MPFLLWWTFCGSCLPFRMVNACALGFGPGVVVPCPCIEFGLSVVWLWTWLCLLLWVVLCGIWYTRRCSLLPGCGHRVRRGMPAQFSVPKLCLWALFLSLWGVGEALTPGPEFTIGVANINGLNNKGFGFADSSVDTWILSETHFTKGGIATFKSHLRQARSPYSAFIHGCPLAARSLTSEIGQWSGVGVLSRFPSRRLPHSWPAVAYNSGRLLCSGFCAKGVWISGVAVYGPPTSPTHVNGRAVTDELLGLALERALQLTGPRFIAGDFNHDLDRLSTVSTMERAFVISKISMLRALVTCLSLLAEGKLAGISCLSPVNWCHCFNPARWMMKLCLTDHSYLIGTFSGAHDCLDRFVWPIPEPMEWTAASCRSPVSLDLFAPGCNLYSDYETFWTEVESHNNRARLQQQKPVVRATTGRGRQRKPQCQDRQIAPTKTSRPGDRQPAFLGTCVQHAQWLKQLRRLQSYVRLARSGISSGAHRAHRFGLWTSILRAPGFAPSFASWWSQRSLALGEPVSVPLVPPDQSLAWILYTLVLNLTSPSSKPLCALLGPMPIGWQKLQMSMPCIALCSVIFPFRWTLWSALP